MRQTSFLPLLMDKTKFPIHLHPFYFDDPENTSSQFPVNGTNRYNTHTICIFKKKLDAFRSTKIHQHIEGREFNAMLEQCTFKHVESTRTTFTKDKRNMLQVFGSYFIRQGKFALSMHDGY